MLLGGLCWATIPYTKITRAEKTDGKERCTLGWMQHRWNEMKHNGLFEYRKNGGIRWENYEWYHNDLQQIDLEENPKFTHPEFVFTHQNYNIEPQLFQRPQRFSKKMVCDIKEKTWPLFFNSWLHTPSTHQIWTIPKSDCGYVSGISALKGEQHSERSPGWKL